MKQTIEIRIKINAAPSIVWNQLTDPEMMTHWMAEPEMGIEIITDWIVGNPIVIKGFSHIKFENRGRVLQFEPNKLLQYNYLSSLSRLPDKPENYSIITFSLSPDENQTLLSWSSSNFPTEIIFRHIEFYWKTTLEILKKCAEAIDE